jgi:hypothetical protein
VPGTGVLLADGRVKPVEEVEVGDRVWATDPETGEEGPRTVVATITSSGIKELVEVTVDIDGADGDKTATVVATAEHPFWVDDQGRWLNADALTPGNDLLTADGERVEVLSTERRTESHRVHNLTINGVHTYHVQAGTKSVLVHNTPPGGCGLTSNPNIASFESITVTPRNIKNYRIDVENPVPGKPGAANIHIQFMGRGADPGKYYLNPETGNWIEKKSGEVLSKKQVRMIDQKYVDKALKMLGVGDR